MDWLDIQRKLGYLINEYSKFAEIKSFVYNVENIEAESYTSFTAFSCFLAAIKRKITEIPGSIDVVKNEILKNGNNLKETIKYLDTTIKDFSVLNRSYEVLKTLVMLLDKNYEFTDGYENSLLYKSYAYKLSKAFEIYENQNMTMKEKYEYCDIFKSNLTEEQKGELLIQSFIGQEDKFAQKKAAVPILAKLLSKDNPFVRMKEVNDLILEMEIYLEQWLKKASLEEQLQRNECILESKYVKNMDIPKKS